MMRVIKSFSLIYLIAMLGGCASVTKGTDQQLTVNTDPTEAKCKLKRDGQRIGVVHPTPGSINLEKSKNDISVECNKDGYQRQARTVDSDFQEMTFGNIIIGGVIGVGVDAATGAMNEYPSSVHLTLPPDEFESEQKRKEYYEDRREDIRENSSDAIAKIKEQCGDPEQKETCAKAIEKVKEKRDERIAELIADRAQPDTEG